MDRLSRVANRMGSDLREGIERLPGLGGIALFVQFADSDEPKKVAFTDGRTVWAGPRYPEYEEAERLFIILHELLHVGLAHPARAREMRLRLADFDPRLYNIACDAIINASLLGVRGLRCPKDAVSLEELLKLLELWPENKSVGEVVRQWSSEALYYALMRAREQVLASKTVSAYTCDLEGDGRIPAADGDEEASADETLRAWRSRLVMARGALAGVLSRLAKELPEVKTPWERVLRDYLYRLAQRKRSPDPSRPSRRWLALERVMRETEGVELPFERGVRASKSARLAVGFDTSASIGDDILARFVAELSAIISKLDPTVRLVVCDAAVHQVFDLAGAEAVRFLRGLKLKGGGGTDFRPAIAAAAEWKPDVMVYLTDLEGEAGEPPRFPVLWATPAGGAVTPWGRRVELI